MLQVMNKYNYSFRQYSDYLREGNGWKIWKLCKIHIRHIEIRFPSTTYVRDD